MGKRKSKAKVVVKKRPTVAKIFDCLFCDHTKSVEVQIKKDTGTIKCRNCNVQNEYPVTALSKAIDVYYDWVDEIDRINNPHQQTKANKADHESEEEEELQPASKKIKSELANRLEAKLATAQLKPSVFDDDDEE